SSLWVRRYLASGLQRLALTDRWRIAEGLVQHSDADDLNLPLLIWYGIEPLVAADRDKAVSLIPKTKIPLIREYLARRLTLLETDAAGDLGGSAPASATRGSAGASPSRSLGLRLLIHLLEQEADPAIQSDVLGGIQAALAGQRRVPMPHGWSELAAKLAESPSSEIRDQALLLSFLFGDAQAMAAVRRIAQDGTATLTTRQKFLEALVYSKDPQ